MNNEKKTFKQAQIWSNTHENLSTLVEYYNEQQDREFGVKAKKVSRAAIIDQLVQMKLFEIRQGN